MTLFLKKRRRWELWILGVILAVLVLFSLNIIQKQLKAAFYFISHPIQQVLWRVGDKTSDFLSAFLKIRSLGREANELKLKNQELLAEIAVLKQLKEENNILRQALDIGLKNDFKILMAEVIEKDIGRDFLLINKGAKDGVLVNMPVVTPQKLVLGKVSDVYKNFSKIMLISDKNSVFDAKVQEKDISGVVRGEGNFKIILDLIPRDKEVSSGDIVVTSSLGGIFPAGLLVGQISNVKKNDVDPFQYIEINPSFNIKDINILFLITEY